MPNKRFKPQYPPEFKTQAVQLVLTSEKSKRALADELGISLSTLCKWVKEHPDTSGTTSLVSPPSAQQALEQENRRLRRELEIVRQEREILKAATRFFAKENT